MGTTLNNQKRSVGNNNLSARFASVDVQLGFETIDFYIYSDYDINCILKQSRNLQNNYYCKLLQTIVKEN